MARILPMLVGGSVLAYLFGRRRRPSVPTPTGAMAGRWVWPVQSYQGRRPVISDGFNSPRPGLARHGGVDVMFARIPSDPFLPRTANGSAHHVMLDDVVALAASDGVLWSASQTPRGFAVVIDHSPFATFYTHLSQLLVPVTNRAQSGQKIHAGQPIGIVGADPMDAEHLKHLHFELWRGGPSDAVDPEAAMRSWEYLSDPRLLPRNASLAYQPIGDKGEPYPDWVRGLKDKSGVYVIRELGADGSAETVYVGESHTDRLYDTLTRHFQTWRRWKGFWQGQYGEGHDPGLTYDRGRVEVAVRITSSSAAIDEEARLIQRLKPRDNLLGQPADDEVPF